LIFVTVGSMFPFDRLIRTIDELVRDGVIHDPVEAQIGDGSYEPKHVPFDRFLSKPDYETKLKRAEMIIAHAGAGTIALALEHHKPLLVLPRQKKFAEHVNDHQIPTARKFAELEHVLVAAEAEDVAKQFPQLRAFRPKPREVHPDRLAARIGDFLRNIPR
jgi:UDP-N-acetylglucosamine transferase subunit ALG13